MTDHGLVREALRLDRSRLAFGAALPGAIGFAIPLAVGLAAGEVADGVTAAIGALIVGFANLGGGYRVRALTLLATALAAGAASLAGGLTGDWAGAAIVLVGLWGLTGGLLVALGPRPAFAGMLSTWALIIAADLHVHGTGALHAAALITAGGLLQTMVAVAAWPLRPHAPERRAVAEAYRALAAQARASGAATARVARIAGVAGAGRAPVDEAASGGAAWDTAAVLARAADVARDGPEQVLVEQGEWIRVELVALAVTGDPAVGALLDAAAEALEAIAEGRGADVAALRARAEAMADPAARDAALMLVARIAQDVRSAGRATPARVLVALRAQLTPRSSAFRHATRLAAALMVAVLAYRVLPVGRGYWVPVTVLFVLKPDYLGTFSRGLARAVGTMLGVVVAAGVAVLGPSDPVVLGLLTVLALAAYTLFPANFGLSSLVLTVVIALLVDFAGGSTLGAVEDRVADTALGGAIALAAFALWPTREADTLHSALATLRHAHARWLRAIVAGLADPAAYDPEAMRRERLATRVARTNAEASLQRATAEPAPRRPDIGAAQAVLRDLARLDDTALVLAETAHDHRGGPPQPLIGDWGRALCAGLDAQADGAAPSPPRAEALALARAAHEHPDDIVLGIVAARAIALVAAPDR